MIEGVGFRVDVTALEDAAAGIDHSVESQDSFELRELCGPPALYGHDRVHSEFQSFCARWSDGLDLLTDDASKVSAALTRAAQGYRKADQNNGEHLSTDPGIAAIADG
ncbi:hypothetical protein [Smaragdicoccus niigatensis]|uniref:hypothetical protein n=1 Tax=Smaragdicoccus niigatensis TaxID=359359 RepID=UPI0012DDD6F0|nr:hypothetical protein [Smaragdicoccus niigatensis]